MFDFLALITENISYIFNQINEIEFSTVFSIIVVIGCWLLSIHISWRRPLYYNMFLVEMHTWSTRRMVQVLHLGQEFTSNVSWNSLVSRMRARAPRVEGDVRVAISDPHIVIQSPNTVIDSPTTARSPDANRLTLWDIEMPPRIAGQAPNATRDSQYAAAAAIAILARGDDGNLRSRVFFDNLRSSDSSPSRNSSVNPSQSTNEESRVSPQLQGEQIINNDVQFSTISERVEQSTTTTMTNQETTVSDTETDLESVTGSNSTNSTLNDEPAYIIERTPLPSESDKEKVLIRLKFLNDTEKETYASLTDTIAKYKGDNFRENEPDKIVRLIFQGQLLRDDNRSLESYGLKSGSVLHCHVSSTPYTTRQTISTSSMPETPSESESSIRQRGTENREENRHTEGRRTSSRRQQRLHLEDGSINWLRVADLLFYVSVHILSALGFDVFHARWRFGRRDRLMLNPSLLWVAFQWIYNIMINDNNDIDSIENSINRQLPSHIFWIFGCQLVAVSSFFFFFPQVVDKTALTLLVLLTLYFVFVVWRNRPSETEEDADIQQEDPINVM